MTGVNSASASPFDFMACFETMVESSSRLPPRAEIGGWKYLKSLPADAGLDGPYLSRYR